MNDIKDQFEQPGPEWRGKPFWSWNGDLKEEELIRQVHVMRDMGLGGFFMHSRTGLITEYLGDEWFRLTSVCADEAERLGMEAWLYDEDRWPSGTAGGLVTENPAYRMQFMRLSIFHGSDFIWTSDIAAAFSCELENTAFHNAERFYADTPSDRWLEHTVLVFQIMPMEPSSFYNGHTYVDTLSADATQRYIEVTHDRYKEHCGARFGKSIQGIFTDEPHRGAVMSGFGLPNKDRLNMTPWTEQLPQRFQEQFSVDLMDNLPELFLYPEGRNVSPIKWQYMELLQQMFLQNFMQPLYQWCEQNNMRLTGHALHEDSLTCQAAMQGSLMRFYEYQHDPGVDVLSEGNRNVLIVKQLSSAARQLGKKWLLSELYGCTGWQMNFRSHKEAGDWQTLFGINLRCQHLSWYTMEGEAKRDYPASILHQSAWWKGYDYVESYFARLGLILSQGKPECSILVLNPIESVWCQIGLGWAEGLSAKTRDIQLLEQRYREITDWLLSDQQDFDIGDEEMISRLGAIEPGPVPTFRVGAAGYKTIVVPHMTTMRGSTLDLMRAFVNAGGRVIFAGDAPAYVDVLPTDAASAFAETCISVPWKRDEFLAACRFVAASGVEIITPNMIQEQVEIRSQIRLDGDAKWLVLLNMSREAACPSVTVQMRGAAVVEEWDCRTGKCTAVPSQIVGICTEFATSLAISGERVFRLLDDKSSATVERAATLNGTSHTFEGPFAYTLEEPNVCVLDMPRWQFGGADWQPAQEILKVDQDVRRACGLALRGGEMVQPWYRKAHGVEILHLGRIELAHEFRVENLPKSPLHLCLERPSEWHVTVNGHSLNSSPEGWWVDQAFEKIEIPSDWLHVGANVIQMEADFHEGLNLEFAYLLGNFGVQCTGSAKTLTALSKTVLPTNLVDQGFPFYGAGITYHVPLPQDAVDCSLRLELPKFEGAYVTVSGAVLAFPPYKVDLRNNQTVLHLELVLTRRNTFGPLHQIPLCASAYGPGNFITSGSGFSDDYVLYPAGLLEPPIISW